MHEYIVREISEFLGVYFSDENQCITVNIVRKNNMVTN